MKYYIEAYYADGSQILGNMDGQGVLHCRQYRRTDHYKFLKNGLRKCPVVAYWKIVTDSGRELEILNNKNFVL